MTKKRSNFPVSIILKTWNAYDHIALCIPSLLQNTKLPFELIIIDNGSNEKVRRLLKKISADPRVQLIENKINIGPGRANIQGFSLANSKYVCLIDSDVLVPEGWLTRMFERITKHNDIKILSPIKYHETIKHPLTGNSSKEMWFQIKQEGLFGTPSNQFDRFSFGMSITELDEAFRKVAGSQNIYIDAPPDFTSSCCVLLDADFISKCGGISDPRFLHYGSEDIDLCWRTGRAGGVVSKTSEVYVHHFHNSSVMNNNLDVKAYLRKSNQLLYGKWKQVLLDLIFSNRTNEFDVEPYLSSYFIFQPLSIHTKLLSDIKQRFPDLLVPEIVTWKHQL
jgi:GT2 family glycosyltransferase